MNLNYKYFIEGHENGDVVQWDIKTQKKLSLKSVHQKDVKDMQTSADGTMLITSSKVIQLLFTSR